MTRTHHPLHEPVGLRVDQRQDVHGRNEDRSSKTSAVLDRDQIHREFENVNQNSGENMIEIKQLHAVTRCVAASLTCLGNESSTAESCTETRSSDRTATKAKLWINDLHLKNTK